MTDILLVFLQADSLLLRHDKVYSILAIILVIFAALLVFLFLTQRKIGKLEKTLEELEK